MANRIGGLSGFLGGVGPSSFGGTGAARPAGLGTGGLPNLNPSSPALKAYSSRGGADGFDAAPRAARGPNLTGGAAPARAPQLDAAAPAAPAGGAQAPAGAQPPAGGAQDPNAPKDPNAAPKTP